MRKYNLVEYNKNYRKTSGTLWNYYSDEPNSGTERNIDYSIKDSKSFDYKTGITENLGDNNRTEEDVGFSIPLKHLINFLRTIDMPLTNCEVSFILTWSENCLLTDKAYGDAVTGNNPVLGINAPIGATFKITDTRLNILAVTLSTEIDNKLLE